MSAREGSWTSRGLQALGLLAVLGFVFSVQYVPHLATFENPPGEEQDPGLLRLGTAWEEHLTGEREGYPWAIHVDEHLHAARIAQVQNQDSLVSGDPYQEDPDTVSSLGGLGTVHERGYYVILAQVQDVTEIQTQSLYQWLPALWMAFMAFGVWAMLRPHPAALPSAAFLALVPSTARFLGTGYLVPIGFALAWMPASAILGKQAPGRFWAGLLALLVTVWAFFVHLIAGFACVAVFAIVALLQAPRLRSRALKAGLVALLPLVALARMFWSDVQAQIAREQRLPIDFTVFDNFGVITLFLWVGGLALLALDPPEGEARETIYAYAALSLLALGAIVGTVYFEFNRYALYSRMHMVLFATAIVPVGYGIALVAQRVHDGLAGLAEGLDHRRGWALSLRALGVVLALGLALVPMTAATSQAVDKHLDEEIYRVMSEDVWQDMNHVATGYDDEEGPYTVFLSHPWQAPFLTEKTGKVPHTVLYPGDPPVNREDWEEYVNGEKELAFFVNNDITLVLGPRPPPGDVWRHEGNGIWLMEEPYAEQIERLRQGKSLQLDALPAEGSS